LGYHGGNMRRAENGKQTLITREQLMLLKGELAKDGRAWATVFVRHAGCEDLKIRNRAYREVLSFATRLAEMKIREAGLATEMPMDELTPRAAMLKSARSDSPCVLTTHLEAGGSPGAKTFATFLAQYCHANQDAPDFTEAMFEEFCLATGLENKVMVGNGVNLACLVFYFVIFGLLGFQAHSTRAERNVLLKDARLCQEHFNALIDQFTARPGKFASLLPLVGLRKHEIMVLAGLRRRRLLGGPAAPGN
jgi:hypothetical protein